MTLGAIYRLVELEGVQQGPGGQGGKFFQQTVWLGLGSATECIYSARCPQAAMLAFPSWAHCRDPKGGSYFLLFPALCGAYLIS